MLVFGGVYKPITWDPLFLKHVFFPEIRGCMRGYVPSSNPRFCENPVNIHPHLMISTDVSRVFQRCFLFFAEERMVLGVTSIDSASKKLHLFASRILLDRLAPVFARIERQSDKKWSSSTRQRNGMQWYPAWIGKWVGKSQVHHIFQGFSLPCSIANRFPQYKPTSFARLLRESA